MKFTHLALIAVLLCASAAGVRADSDPEIPNAEASAAFAAADKNGNGALTYAEFAAADQTPDALTRGAIDQVDLNNDGQLSAGEIVAAINIEIAQASDSNNDGKNDADANGNGVVTHAELQQDSPLMAEMDANKDGTVSASEVVDMVAPIVAALDQDGNGKLSVDEMKDGVADLFQAVDTNNDGQVSGAELQSHHREVAAATQGVCSLPTTDVVSVSDFSEAAGADGQLNQQEFRDSYIGLLPTVPLTPAQADPNGDQIITPAEHQQALENRTAEQVACVVPILMVAPQTATPAEIPNVEADAAFAAADKNGDGALTYGEFAAADQTPDALTRGTIDQIDLNNDGEMSVGELATALEKEIVQASDSNNDGKNDADANGNGVVTHAELKRDSPLMAAMDTNKDGTVSAGEVADMVAPVVAALDQNGNGQVSVDEMKDGIATLFETVDINKDGLVSGAELQAHHRQMAAATQGVCSLPPTDVFFVFGFSEAAGADGQLNPQEFRDSYTVLLPTVPLTPAQADPNGDQVITPAEHQQALENRTAEQVVCVVPILAVARLLNLNGTCTWSEWTQSLRTRAARGGAGLWAYLGVGAGVSFAFFVVLKCMSASAAASVAPAAPRAIPAVATDSAGSAAAAAAAIVSPGAGGKAVLTPRAGKRSL